MYFTADLDDVIYWWPFYELNTTILQMFSDSEALQLVTDRDVIQRLEQAFLLEHAALMGDPDNDFQFYYGYIGHSMEDMLEGFVSFIIP